MVSPEFTKEMGTESPNSLDGHTTGDKGFRSQSVADISSLEGHTLYEKKCVLINREIDQMGMGRYQWCIWWLCGFGYLLDLMWAMAFGLVLSPLQQEFGFACTWLWQRSLMYPPNIKLIW